MKYKQIVKHALRQIGQSKARFLSILAIVMLGEAIFVGVSAAGPVMKHTVDLYFKQTDLADIQVISSVGLVEEDLNHLRDHFHAQVEGQYMEDAVIKESNQLMRIRSLVADSSESLNQYVVLEGRLPQQAGEIALDAQERISSQYEIGQTIHFTAGSSEDSLSRLQDQTYEVVGFVANPLYIENGQRGATPLGSGRLDGFAVVGEEDFESDFYQLGYLKFPASDSYQAYEDAYHDQLEDQVNQVDQVLTQQVENRLQRDYDQAQAEIDQGYQDLADAEAELEAARQDLDQAGLLSLNPDQVPPPLRQQVEDFQSAQQTFENEKAEATEDLRQAEEDLAQVDQPEVMTTHRFDQSAYVGYGQNADRIEAIARVFPAFFFLVAILVTLTTMTRMVDEGRKEIGILKSFGYGNGAVSFQYVFYSLAAGFIGFLLGLSGYYIFPSLIYNAYGSIYTLPDVTLRTYGSYTFIALAGALLSTVGSTLFALRPTLQIQPAQLMQAKAPKQGKRILLEAITPLWNALSFNYKVTFRNLFRYKKRMFMTIIGIAGCTALMLMGFGISDSLNDLLYDQYHTIDRYDAIVAVSDQADDDDLLRLDQSMSDHDLVDSQLFIQSGQAKVEVEGVEDQTLNLIAPQQADKIPAYKQLVSVSQDEVIDLPEEGVLISEKLAEMKGLGPGDSIEVETEEGQILRFHIHDVIRQYVGHDLYMQADYYESVSGQPWQADLIWLLFESTAAHEDELAQRVMDHEATDAIIFVSQLADQFEETLGSLDGVVTVLILSASLLAFVVLYNLTNVNIGERQRELATIKVLGFYDSELSMYILRENIFLTLFGILLGFVLGIFLHRYIILTVEFSDVMFGRTIHLSSYLWASLLTVIFSLIVMLAMHFKLKQTDMVEALGEE